MEQMYNRRMLHRKDDRRRPGTCPAVAPGQGVYGVPEGVPNTVQPPPEEDRKIAVESTATKK